MLPSLVFLFTGPFIPRHKPMMSLSFLLQNMMSLSFLLQTHDVSLLFIHYKSQKIQAIKRKLAYIKFQRQSLLTVYYFVL